jgi:glycosyltransferase involved in cell wall biosynthesis
MVILQAKRAIVITFQATAMSRPQFHGVSASVIIPSYESQATVTATLQSLRDQLFRDFETILIDSGTSDEVARIAAEFPEVRYHRIRSRLLPHQARNVGAELARNDILVFTDPDIVAAPDWLEKLICTYRAAAGPVVGAISSLQRTWLETGIHIAKFDLWLNLCAWDKLCALRRTPLFITIIAAHFTNFCGNVSCAALILPGCECASLSGRTSRQSAH